MPQINRQALDAFKNFKLNEQGLKGTALTNEEKVKTIDNGVSTVSFFKADGVAGGPVPFLNADPAPAVDAQKLAKVIEATPERLAQLANNPASFAALITETVNNRAAYLKPRKEQVEGAATQYKFNAIVGQRIEQFVNEGVALAQEIYGRNPAQLNQALYAVNTAGFDLYSREVRFDDFEVNGYASFGHDAAFIHAWELRLAELNKVDVALLSEPEKAALAREKAQLQGELDGIFRSKYVYNSSSMYELNAEVSVGLCLIDKDSRQRLSEIEGSRKTIVPKFEILNVQHEGQNKAVYFDVQENKYYFDKSDVQVPADLVPQIQRQAVQEQDATFRRAVAGEHLRKNFRFDWDGDGQVSKSVIDWVGWAGHCDVKAMLETHGLVLPQGDQGVYEYDSRSGSTAHYSRDILNEKLMSMGELSATMVDPRTGRRSSVANEPERFAGGRDDDRPDRILLGGDTKLPWSDRPNKFDITQITVGGKTYQADEVFREHIVAADQKSATKNPLYAGMVEGDRVQLKLANAKIEADASYRVFDPASGYTEMKSERVVLDFANPAAQPVMVDTILEDAQKRIMYEVKIDTANKQWVAQKIQMVENAGGGYERTEMGQPLRRPIDVNNMVAQRETNLDDPAQYMPFVKEALQTARNFTSETADGAGVWNGRTKSLRQATVWRDDNTKWAKVTLDVDARFGGNQGSFLVKLKDDGKPDYFVPLTMPFDFAWRIDSAFAPVFGGAVNETALERGVVSQEGGRFTAEAVGNMMELLHCAFSQRRFVINHFGQRYYFENRADFDAAKAKLDQLRAAAVNGGQDPGPGPGPIGTGTLLELANRPVVKGALDVQKVVAEADGEIKLVLDTKAGDADLYVNVGGAVGAEQGKFTHRSWNSDLNRDELTIAVKKGDVLNIGVHGYKESSFDLKVTGPKAGAVEPPPAGITAHLTGVLNRGEFKNLETYPIEVPADGLIRFTMAGSGDADLFVGVNREPDNRTSDYRLTGSTSNETGTLRVKKGDKLYIRTFGYAARSEFDLNVKSE